MYFVSIRERFPMRSDGLGRALACILAAVVCGGIGSALGAFLGPFLFVPVPESDVSGDRTTMLAMVLFLLFGLGGILLCRRLTAGLPEGEPKEPNVGTITGRTRWLIIATALVAAVTNWPGFGLYSVIDPSVLGCRCSDTATFAALRILDDVCACHFPKRVDASLRMLLALSHTQNHLLVPRLQNSSCVIALGSIPFAPYLVRRGTA